MLGLQVQYLASTRVLEQTLDEHEHAPTVEHKEEHGLQHRKEDLQQKILNDGIGASLATVDQISSSESSSTSASASDAGSDSCSDSDSDVTSTNSLKDSRESLASCIQEAQLSSDGTCIFTADFNRTFSVYSTFTGIPDENGPRPLKPYASFTSPDPIWAFAAHPLFNCNDPNSTKVLISRRDRYITLHNALWDTNNSAQPNPTDVSDNIASPITSYKLINSNTEAIIAPTSLTFSHSGTRFFAGHQNRIAPFDVERPDIDPIQIPTIPAKRSKRKGGGRGFKGWISALSLSPPSTLSQGGLLAAGARTRHVGIYDAISNEEVTTFDLKGTVDMKLGQKMGNGVSHLKYSPCGTYLYVAERQSDVLLIYDVRKFSLALGYCTGRKALTTQKLGFDVWNRGVSPYEGETLSHEIWAGGTDGVIRVWRDPYLKEGAVDADEVVQIGDGNAPVVETMVHKIGNLAVAACGRMQVNDDESESEGMGRKRGGTLSPKFREWGSLEILGLH